MSWVYKQTEARLWTVGFYDSNGAWNPESDHDSAEQAASRVHWLNGGGERQRQAEHTEVAA